MLILNLSVQDKTKPLIIILPLIEFASDVAYFCTACVILMLFVIISLRVSFEVSGSCARRINYVLFGIYQRCCATIIGDLLSCMLDELLTY